MTSAEMPPRTGGMSLLPSITMQHSPQVCLSWSPAGSSDPVAPCSPCEQPVATIYAPKRVSAPCGNATIDPIKLSSSNSISPSGRPFQSVKWELVSAPSGYDNDLPGDDSLNLYKILSGANRCDHFLPKAALIEHARPALFCQ
eukprot:scaffold200807_cov17-Tisochrysis_lutea.AAC.1